MRALRYGREEARARKRARRTGRHGCGLEHSALCSGFWVRARSNLASCGGLTSDPRADVCAQRGGHKLPESLLEILSDARLWSSLCHAQTCPFAEVESFGYAQPGVRTYAWALLLTLLEYWHGASPANQPYYISDKVDIQMRQPAWCRCLALPFFAPLLLNQVCRSEAQCGGRG